ncbi:MAG: PKD domain-containing protein, partial [Bacteroidota bacterium]
MSKTFTSSNFRWVLLTICSFLLTTAYAQIVISEFQPNPPGGDPTNQDVELSGGVPGAAFDLWLVSVESDGPDGLVDRTTNVTGTFDANGFAVVSIPDLENPSFTLILAEGFSGTVGTTDIDADDDGTADNISAFTNILDAVGISDSNSDNTSLYGVDLGGTDMLYNGDNEPELVFRDGADGTFYAIADLDDPALAVYDASGTSISTDAGDWTADPTVPTFGAANPTLGATSNCPDVSTEFAYSETNLCPNGLNPTVSTVGTGVLGVFSATPTGLSLDPSTGEIDVSASTAGSYTVTNTIPANGTNGDLVITGVVDGDLTGGLPKAVELYVISDIADLSLYGIGSANNGGGTEGQEFTFPAIAVTAGTYIYVASESAMFMSYFGFAPDYTDNALLINGDDAIELFFNGAVIDQFGETDVDGTGQAWEYTNGWAYRDLDGFGPDGGFILSSWDFSGPDGLDGETSNATAANPMPIGTYTGDLGCTDETFDVNVTILPASDASCMTATCTAPSAEFEYDDTTLCTGDDDPTLTLVGAAVGGVFSVDVAGLDFDPCTGDIDVSESAAGTYVITNTLAANGTNGDLLITGVIDGPLTGGEPKAVELYAVNNIADLSNYGIGSANNGNGTGGEEFTFPAVSVAAGTFIYVATESTNFMSFFGFSPDYTDNAASINGDDAIELFFNGAVIDQFGKIDVDGTGEAWEYLDGWAYRDLDGYGPDAGFAQGSWIYSGPNALDDETSNATAANPMPIGTYVGNIACEDVTFPVTVTVSESPTVDAGPDLTKCPSAPLPIDATISGGTPPYTIAWSATGGTFDDATVEDPTYNMMTEGTYTLTLTVTDDNGCEVSDDLEVTVEDDIDPEALCQNLAVQVDATTASVTITPDQIDDGSTDNCGIASLALSQTTFTCADEGDNDVVLTVTDESGNEDAITCTVTVEDDNVPFDFGCINDLNVTLGDDCTLTLTADMVITGAFLQCVDEAIVTINDTNSDQVVGCGDHTYMVVLREDGEDIYTCWGNLFAEDKTAPEIEVCPADTDEVTVTTPAQQASGTLATTDPTINLANFGCFQDFFSPDDGQHEYDLVSFTVSAADIYTFFVGSADAINTNFAIFQGDFNPDNPCENIIGSTENGFLDDGGVTIPIYQISLPLIEDQTYTILVSNRFAGSLGAWNVNVYSEAGGLLNDYGITGTIDLTRDLLCTDLEDGIQFAFPQSWILNADGSLDYDTTSDEFFDGPDNVVEGPGQDDLLDAFLAKLGFTGIPTITDNCGQILVTVSDVLSEEGDCGELTLTRTFTATDRYDNCTDSFGDAATVVCTQIITARRPTLNDLVFPPFTATIECDEQFATDGAVGGPDDNPAASVTGHPFVRSAFGFKPLEPNFCNIGASYSDEPRIVVCEGTYKYRREWNLIDWCNPNDNEIYDQFIKVGDYTAPTILADSDPVQPVPTTLNVSTAPNSCLANIIIPVYDVVDGNGCS